MDVVVNGKLVHYVEFHPEQKQVLVMLHGWGHDSSMWLDFASKHLAQFRVIIPDLPLFGRSQALSETASLPDYATWVKMFCQQLDLKDLYLLGHSTGGQISVYVAVHQLIKLRKLILVAPAVVRYEEKVLPASIKLLRFLSQLKPYLPKVIVNSLSTSSDYAVASKAQREVMKRFIRFSVEPLLTRIEVPALCVWGERDRETLGVPKKLAHQIENGRLRVIYDAGHNLHLEKPDVLARMITHFIDS
jgi:pimeloyl-ACP methyl ester carboxylesterase